MTVKCKNKNCKNLRDGVCTKDEIVIDVMGGCYMFDTIKLCGTCRFKDGEYCRKIGFTVDDTCAACERYEERERESCCGSCGFYIGGVCEKIAWDRIEVREDSPACAGYQKKE